MAIKQCPRCKGNKRVRKRLGNKKSKRWRRIKCPRCKGRGRVHITAKMARAQAKAARTRRRNKRATARRKVAAKRVHGRCTGTTVKGNRCKNKPLAYQYRCHIASHQVKKRKRKLKRKAKKSKRRRRR